MPGGWKARRPRQALQQEDRRTGGRSEGEIVEEVDWRIRQNEKEESNHGK